MAAAIILGLLSPLIEIGKLVAKPIQRQCNYLFCLHKNRQALEKEAQELKNAREPLEDRVKRATDNGRRVFDQVTAWFDKAGEFTLEQESIDRDIENVRRGCIGIKSRYVLSKRARKMADKIKEHRERSTTFGDTIAHHPRAPAHVPSVNESVADVGTDVMEFQSRKGIEEEIMAALRGKTATRLGIWGMGGLGKTTMAINIMDRVKKEHLFKHVLMVVVGQDYDVEKIQKDIARWLDFKLEEGPKMVKAEELRKRLSVTKEVFIVIDDVWNEVNLRDVGIPSEGVTILLTSRNVDVFKKMNALEFGMKTLDGEEARELFKEKSGFCLDGDGHLVPTANKIVQECKGLPLAVAVLGSSLRGEEDIQIWEDTLHQLQHSNVENIPGFLKEVYPSLKVSYERLDGGDAKKLFLLCSQFPEDWNISLDDELAVYCVGLRLFGENYDVKQTKDRLHTVVKMLKGRSLMLEGYHRNYVKMHDVVRDVAHAIIDHDKSSCQFVRRGKLITSRETYDEHYGLLSKFSHPKFEFLVINWSSIGFEEEKMLKDLLALEGLKDLIVLHLNLWTNNYRPSALPLSMKPLANLHVLVLRNCKVECISIIGELLELEILRCIGCDCITELPIELKELKRLKVFEFERCRDLWRIVPGVISNLVELEELTVWDCFDGWTSINADGEENENGNASLKELESLKKLRVLKIEIADVRIVEEDIQLRTSFLTKYGIRIGSSRNFETKVWNAIYGSRDYEKFIYIYELEIPERLKFGNWIYELMSMAEVISFQGVEEIYNDGLTPRDVVPFKNLKELYLSSIPWVTNLGKVPNQNATLDNLCKIDIWRCDNLKCLFFIERVEKVVFRHLKSLCIRQCSVMEQLFYSDGNDETINCHVIFPELEMLILHELPSLGTFIKGVDFIEFPSLTELGIEECPKFTRFVSAAVQKNLEGHDNGHLHQLFNNQEVAFGSLELHDDFSNFKNLKELCLTDLPEFVHIFSNDQNGMSSHVIFSNLKKLVLSSLFNLQAFFHGTEKIGFPVLEELDIRNCPKLVDVVPPSCSNHKTTFGSLKKLTTSTTLNCLFKEVEDLSIRDWESIRSLDSSIMMEDCINLKKLTIKNCREMEKVIANESNYSAFKNLEEISLGELPTLSCLFSWTMREDQLLQHDSLRSESHDEMMKGNYAYSYDDENQKKGMSSRNATFSNLKELSLCDLVNLTALCDGVESVDFPMLESMHVVKCPKFVSVISSFVCKQNNEDGEGNESLHLFCSSKVTFDILKSLDIRHCQYNNIWCHQILPSFFTQLKELWIADCNKIRVLFSFTIIQNLDNLEELRIYRCNEIEKVIGDEERDFDKPILFPRLKTLDLYDLPMLEKFWQGISARELPLLETVYINMCPQMKYFTSVSLTTPKLETMELDWKEVSARQLNEFGGLNGMLQRQTSKRVMELSPRNKEEENEKKEIEDEKI